MAWRLRGLPTPFAAAQDSRRLQRAQELLEVFDEQREARKTYAKDHEEYAKEESR